MSTVEKVKEFIVKEFSKPTACYKDSFEEHFVVVVKYALRLAEKQNADKEIVEIAAWLHDIGSIMGHSEDHHEVGAKIAEELLAELRYPKEKIDRVKQCILTHRGSVLMKKESKEAQILTDADAMAQFDNIDGLMKRVYKNKKDTLAKLERSYVKLSEESKPMVKAKLEQAREELK